jgi:hypothetical protein
MGTRKRKKGESTGASDHRGVPGRRHYEYAPPESNEQGRTDAVRSASSVDAHGQRTRNVRQTPVKRVD